ncbi:hypothetical protein ACFLXL_02240 [Chloroflexota bacterium]
MEQKVLAAIMGAVTAYIQQEENDRGVYRNKSNAWWLLGQRRQMNANTSQTIPILGREAWRYGGLERSMIIGKGWNINKISGRDFST